LRVSFPSQRTALRCFPALTSTAAGQPVAHPALTAGLPAALLARLWGAYHLVTLSLALALPLSSLASLPLLPLLPLPLLPLLPLPLLPLLTGQAGPLPALTVWSIMTLATLAGRLRIRLISLL
jgi:hypothetical protein